MKKLILFFLSSLSSLNYIFCQSPVIDIDGTFKSSRYFLGSELGLFPLSSGQSTIQSYWGLKLIGNSQLAPQNYTSSNTGSPDEFSVMIPNQQPARTGFIIRAAASQTADLMQWQDNNGNIIGVLKADGRMGIGVANFSDYYKLAVDGNIVTRRIKITQGSSGVWPDYVFDSNYKLLGLDTLESYIRQHKHLPEVASATQVGTDGLDIGDTQGVLLKKIEELTLYIIELNKKVNEQAKLLQQYRSEQLKPNLISGSYN